MLSQLVSKKGSNHEPKRLGRGPGSGLGKTSGRGHKGKKARTGGQVPRSFEGGQMPIHRRLPKFGFTNIFAVKYSPVNLSQLERFSGSVTPEQMVACGIAKPNLPIKILGTGNLSKKLQVKAHKFSAQALEKIKSAGGSVEEIK
ncbi:MAG: 50S ribosomal protein L15 [Oligoflexia bacterium]|nr:50S ribosomal protein L15 [Oligoflexia bacterium]